MIRARPTSIRAHLRNLDAQLCTFEVAQSRHVSFKPGQRALEGFGAKIRKGVDSTDVGSSPPVGGLCNEVKESLQPTQLFHMIYEAL
jgi:hypothetical protein